MWREGEREREVILYIIKILTLGVVVFGLFPYLMLVLSLLCVVVGGGEIGGKEGERLLYYTATLLLRYTEERKG